MTIVRNFAILFFTLWSIWATGQSQQGQVDWNNQYNKELQQIKNLQEQGQNRSASIKAEELFDQAVTDNNIPGIIASLKLLIENIYRVDDEAMKSVLVKIGKLEPGHPVVAALIHSYQAELLTQYYERHRYRISKVQFREDLSWTDIERWSASQMENTVDSLYRESVKPDQLKKISSEKIESLMEDDAADIHFELRPRLFDLLQERFIQFLINNRFHWSPVKESPDQSTVDQLTNQDLSEYLDSHSLKGKLYQIVKAYDQWEQSLVASRNAEAYIDVLLQRINYVANYLDSKYRPASVLLIQSLIRKYPHVRNRLNLDHALAKLQFDQGNYVTALETLQRGADNKPDKSYPNSVDKVERLIRTIKAPELNVQVEAAYPSGQQPLTSIHFRNLDRVRMELYGLSTEEFLEFRFSDSRREKSAFNLTSQKTAIWEKTINLPESHDYKSHRTEYLINRTLNKGAYAIRYWYRKDDLDLSGVVLFQVTNLTLISESDQNQNKLYVINRQSGKSIEGANVEAITIIRHPHFKNTEIRILSEEERGSFIPPEKQMNQYYKVRQGNDLYISPLTYRSYVHHSSVQPFRRTVLLTDRSVYKPGQTIHFKALTVLTRKLDSELLKNHKIDLSLRNANGKEVWQKTYYTDDWGTVTGTISIPTSGLKGKWSLQVSPSGSTDIRVEEYQRPNFEVILPDSLISRKDNVISLKGEARTYHGFPVQNGRGDIQVELQRRTWFYSIRPENVEVIHNGDFRTDKQGNFEVTFKGVDPPESHTRYGAFYFYSIHINVQAPSGEIRETTKTIPLDPDKVQVSVQYPDFQKLDHFAPAVFSVKDALQQSGSVQADIQISRLESPQEYKVNRHWAVPDQPMMTTSQFRKKIDHLFYNHQASLDDWKEEKQVKSWIQKLEDKDTLDMNGIIGQPGYYRITVRSEKGDTLSVSSFGVGDSGKDVRIVHDAVEVLMSNQTAQPGETVKLNIYTPEESKGGKLVIAHPGNNNLIYDLDKQNTIEIKVGKKDRGGIHIRVFGYLANRFYKKSLFLDVPWSNKSLDISGIDILSNIEVNSDTSLNINVKNHTNAAVNAEVAVAIYDASLDAYMPHGWMLEQSFFRQFSNPIILKDISAALGSHVTSNNNYWEDRYHTSSLILPQLPHLALGYMHLPYARRAINGMKITGYTQTEAMESTDAVVGHIEVSAGDHEKQNLTGSVEEPVHVRKDFAETLVFYGKAMTDSSGHVNIPFQTNDKAGRWKILVFAHTQDLSSGVLSHTFKTYQDLILESYLPDMVRQGDEMELNFTLYNNAEKSISGQVQFQMNPFFKNENAVVYKKNLGFELKAGKSTILSLPITIDRKENNPLIFTAQVVDDAGKIWDATEEVVAVYPSAETIYDGDVAVLEEGENWSGKESRDLLNGVNGMVTIRVVQNMYSELLKSIPYLQYTSPITTDQYFKNGIQALMGQYLTEKIPGFEKIYEEWKRKGELENRLAQNQDKKYVNLDNTPWVRQSESGTEQMALLGLFFDKSHMTQVIESNLTKWAQSQNEDGGFPWIKDGPSSFYMTVRFLAQWNKLEWTGLSSDHFTIEDRNRAQEYADGEFLKLWNKMKEHSTDSTIYYQRFIPYFTQRAYDITEEETSDEFIHLWNELKDSIYTNWTEFNSGLRADIGTAAWHLGNKKLSREIVDALVDNAIRDPRLGIYWRYNNQSSQIGYLGILARITELLILNDVSSLNNGITQWVLVNKMTKDWQKNPHLVSLMLSLLKMKAGWTTTSKTRIVNDEHEYMITGMGDAGDITLNAQELNSFGIDHVEGPPIWIGIITKKVVEPEDEVPQSGGIVHIQKIVTGLDGKDSITTGDQLTVRLIISADRDLDYVYVEDPLVPGMDPGISLSGYQWQFGLSYYQSFDTSSARFYIHHLPKGEYILEYNLGAVRSGKFRHPRTKIQSYFVPEITGYDLWKPVVKVDSL